MKHVKSGDVVGFALAIGAPTAFYTPEMSAGADIVIAEVNDQMPKVYGDNWMPISAFDYFVEHSIPIPEFKRKGEPSEVEFAIAENVTSLIKDGIGKGKKVQ